MRVPQNCIEVHHIGKCTALQSKRPHEQSGQKSIIISIGILLLSDYHY